MARRSELFRFKQFSIDHSRATMKVGTDGVLLGAWTNVGNAKRILDIGTGSGLIALMLAQRSAPDATIEAVEIERTNADQAVENVFNSPWPNKILVQCQPVQTYQPNHGFDCIVSNPPFFINSFQPPDQGRLQSRHTDSLTFEELLDSVVRLLDTSGNFNVILPFSEGLKFQHLASLRSLFCTRQWAFHARKGKPVERWLFEFSRDYRPCDKGEIFHYDMQDEWTVGYKNLVQDFYLKA
jgi:tRNA1Val (adenine37-N6)-methyltransferase